MFVLWLCAVSDYVLCFIFGNEEPESERGDREGQTWAERR